MVSWRQASCYFTLWALNFEAGAAFIYRWLPPRHPLRRTLRDTAVTVAAIVALGGAYIAYVQPRRIVLPRDPPREPVVLEGPALLGVDLLFHQLPLLCWVSMTAPDGPPGPTGLAVGVGLLLVYLAGHDVNRIYGLCWDQDVLGRLVPAAGMLLLLVAAHHSIARRTG